MMLTIPDNVFMQRARSLLTPSVFFFCGDDQRVPHGITYTVELFQLLVNDCGLAVGIYLLEIRESRAHGAHIPVCGTKS